VKALEERRQLREIRFPNVEGYRVVFPRKPLNPVFTKNKLHSLQHDLDWTTDVSVT
jgi:type III restriction enzyme